MNRTEAIKFLAMVKVAYPNSYKDMDKVSKQATVNMWQTSFSDTPFAIVSMAFDNFRRHSTFPPTVAEINKELASLYYKAMEDANTHKWMGNNDGFNKCRYIMQCTVGFKENKTRINYGEITSEMISGKAPYLLGGE